MAEIKTVAVNWTRSDAHNTISDATSYALASALAKALGWTLDGTKIYNTQKAYFFFDQWSNNGASITVSNGTISAYSESVAGGSADATEGLLYLHYIKTDKTVAVGITNTDSSKRLTCGITQTADDNILMFGSYNSTTTPICIFSEHSTSLCRLPYPSFSANNAIAFRLPDPINGGLCDDVFLLYYSPTSVRSDTTTVISIGGKSFAVLCGAYVTGNGSAMVKLC